ncbi:hypothetical protein DOTSEDRAFT_153255 [Dothistroma septosporum NZE10]|uniref:Dipeptidylpeptidase IV N-terminal domain-containing protein n=1 Tax=Dothistroma septosporum (strain NZE10 / CBS 128990) TaxID=675120 RepID=M2YM80_DOTSN|nr:hypothetical protein DOTSEDRAFT_153255 [Dothistroma septosporum NZE10]
MTLARLGPAAKAVWMINSDGSNPHSLLGDSSHLEYHASFSPDGQFIVFTSERNGPGNADLFRIRADGSDLEELVATPFVEDQGVLSPDNSKLAYVSTSAAEGQDWKANIWVMDLKTKSKTCLTNTEEVKGVPWSPDGYFKPQWSPDGDWIIFSSDRNTAWTNHGDGTGWEHTQELSIYAIRPDGSDFRRIITMPGYSLGSPKWSKDGKRISFYHLELEQTYNVRNAPLWSQTVNQIYSVDFATGQDIKQETNSNTLKVAPQFVNDTIAYVVKGGDSPVGIYYNTTHLSTSRGGEENPCWSSDGTKIIFETNVPRPFWQLGSSVYSWDQDWDYRIGEQFPALSKQGKLASPNDRHDGITIQYPNNTDSYDIFNSQTVANATQYDGPLLVLQPAWSPDGEWLAFSLGGCGFLQDRSKYTSWIYRIRADGSHYERLTDGTVNSGYPSYAADGNSLVYRVWGAEYGLRILDLKTHKTRVLTTDTLNDNTPSFSPDGEKIVFTRRMNESNYDICTIRPDGSDLQVLTTSAANDGHATWTADGRIHWSSGQNGWTNEAAAYWTAEQPYGKIWIMDADGGNKRQLTDSIWEDAMPIYFPNEIL